MIEPKRIIRNGIATIVFWNDGTKTIVKCAADDEPDDYMAFCAAYCKKVFGSNSHLKRVIKNARNAKPKKEDIHNVSNTKSLSANFSLAQNLIDDYRRDYRLYMENRIKSEIVSLEDYIWRWTDGHNLSFQNPCRGAITVNMSIHAPIVL